MRIFVDEAGTFTGTGRIGSVSTVGALVIADGQLARVEKKYAALRKHLPKQNGEVKGRLLSEDEVDRVVQILIKNEALFEITAVDLGLHSDHEITEHQNRQAEGMTKYLGDDIPSGIHEDMWDLRHRLEQMPPQLYVQSIVTFAVIWRTIEHSTLYFCQRRPEELGAFHWVIDAKEKEKITDWEDWWSFSIMPYLQSKSKREPMTAFSEGDYTHFAKFEVPGDEQMMPYADTSKHALDTNLRLLLTENFRFSPDP
jgi:hypothetical protein